jgi:hypothetical protein
MDVSRSIDVSRIQFQNNHDKSGFMEMPLSNSRGFHRTAITEKPNYLVMNKREDSFLFEERRIGKSGPKEVTAKITNNRKDIQYNYYG